MMFCAVNRQFGRAFCAVLGLCLFIAIQHARPARASRHFWRGRPRNGTLGAPSPHDYCQDGAGQTVACSPLPDAEWFEEQLLDHFDPTNVQTWRQRFYTNGEHYKPGGPIFLMIGGEGEATAKWMVQGAWAHYAREHNALMFQLEHRFYGQSRPTK